MRTLLLCAVLTVAACAQAQELDIFDVNDFVDPRDLGATIATDGRIECPCHHLFVSRLFTGVVSDYVDLLTPTNADVVFGNLATSYYTGRWQVNLKLSMLEAFNTPRRGPYLGTPDYKVALQLGRYYTLGGDGGKEPTVLRAQLVWSMKDYGLEDSGQTAGGPAHLYDEERGVEIDVAMPLFGRRLNGSLVFVEDIPARAGFTEPQPSRRLTFIHRFSRRVIANMQFDPSLAVGGYRSGDGWSSVTVLPSLEVTSPTIPRIDTRLHVRYQPLYQRVALPSNSAPPPIGWKLTHQVAVFIDRPIF